MAKSITKETKTKFESLLKVALSKRNTKSTQNLIDNDEGGNDEIQAATLDTASESINLQNIAVNKHFIMDKFLNDEDVKENEVSFIKPPVPKPRKKVLQKSFSNSTNNTHSVKSTKILNVVDDNSSDSNKTYDLPKRISREDSNLSDSSARTYNVDDDVIGDILYHDKVSKTSVIEMNRESSSLGSHKLSQHEIEMANFNEEPVEKMQTIEDILNETENKSVDSSASTKITFENEIKGKKKKKKNSFTETVNERFYSYEKILNIIVHHTDKLELDCFVIHPVVKVYVMNDETGEFIKKSDKTRAAVLYMENKTLGHIMPVMTQNFNLQEKRQFTPEWEESIIINEDFTYITDPNTKVILFFQILDFLGFSQASSQSSSNSSRGWYDIAWAFLKINGGDGTTNTDKKLRLQLYKPGKANKNPCPVFDWWRTKRIKYPSTLYVTVKSIASPDTVVETFRAKTPLEKEKSISIVENGISNYGEEDTAWTARDKSRIKTVLAALDTKTSQLPNNLLTEIESEEEGCFVVKFSNTGLFLAVAVLIDSDYTLVLYTVPEFESYYKLPSHQELIYSISFNNDDTLVATSSSDGTVCVWNLKKWYFQQMLPHPAFVYWCEISTDNTIATGCYDKVVRIWTINNNSKNKEYMLIDELEGHSGYITSLCFNSNSDILYSSDSRGEIFIWKRQDCNWSRIKVLRLPDLKDTIINQIVLHKKERKLIVHARDSIIRIVDVKNECTIHWLEGALNSRVRTLCCITPCGSYVISGSDNGIIHVWSADTGKSIAKYQPYNKLSIKHIPIHGIDFSPIGNLMAFSHFGHRIPINVYNFDKKKCSVNYTVISEEKRWKDTVENMKFKKNNDDDERNSDSNKEKDVNLQQILEKIDRLIS